MTTVRLAWGGPRGPLRDALGADRDQKPAILVSYWYAGAENSRDGHQFGNDRSAYKIRNYALDSGAFSAWKGGAEINNAEYVADCQYRVRYDHECADIFALDVIGDWRASMINTERMWEAGVPAIPTYHVGEPEHVLRHYAKHYPKIALGGAVGMHGSRKIKWAKACLHKIWPTPVHGFGFGGEQAIMAIPFHSVDATNWQASPVRWGRWESMPGASYRGWASPLRVEVDWWLRLERRAQQRWRREMKILDEMIGEACTPSRNSSGSPHHTN